MKRHIFFFISALTSSLLWSSERLETETMPEFFYLVVWNDLWENNKKNEHISLKSPAAPFLVTTFVSLFQGENQLNAHLHRLSAAPFFPYAIFTLQTKALCDPDGVPRKFSKDRFGYYRFNDTVIPKTAILSVQQVIQNPHKPIQSYALAK